MAKKNSVPTERGRGTVKESVIVSRVKLSKCRHVRNSKLTEKK